jgi:hypothetical protein
MITWSESVLSIVGVVDRCKFVVGAWVVTPSCIWFLCHRGSSYWSSRSLCRDCGCCPLACRHCHVCVGRVVVSIC